MKNTMRTLVVLAGMTALAASSQAVITFSSWTADFQLSGTSSNQITSHPAGLSNFIFGAGTSIATGSFDVMGTKGIDDLEVNEVASAVSNGTLNLTVTLEGATPVTLYDETATPGGNLTPIFQNNPLPNMTGVLTVDYTATYTGNSASSYGYLGTFAVNAYEPVPEPASIATVGLGIIGLISRRRRSGK